MKNGKKSKFKGFSLRNKQYTISSFECKGCPNYCEINRVKLEGEEKIFFMEEDAKNMKNRISYLNFQTL